MGDPLAPASLGRAAAPLRAGSERARRLLAAFPFTFALALAAATLNAALAPTHDVGEDLRMKNAAPPPPAESSPVHHDEAIYDPMELISV